MLRTLRYFCWVGMVVFASCQNSPSSSATTLKIGIKELPPIYDPRAARDAASGNVLRMLFEGLTRVGADQKIELALAEAITASPDGKHYHIRLKPSTWSDGTALTAYDFERSWKAILSPDFPSGSGYQLFCVKNGKAIKEGKLPSDQLGIHVSSNSEFDVELEHPETCWLEMLSFPAFFPCPSGEWINANGLPQAFNGPFSIDHIEHGTLILRKNTSYWDAEKVSMERVELIPTEEEVALRLFEKGELDWVGSPFGTFPFDALQKWAHAPELHKEPILGTYFIRMNVAVPAIQNKETRQRLSESWDREQVIREVTYATQLAAYQFVPPQLGLPASSPTTHVLSAPREIVRLHLMYHQNERNHRLAQALQQAWKEQGFDIVLEPSEMKIFFDRLKKGNYEMAICSWIADISDPINFLEIFKEKNISTNNTNWESSSFKKQIEKASHLLTGTKRSEILRQCEKELLEEAPIIPLFHCHMLYLKNLHLQGTRLTSLGILDIKYARKEPSL